MLDSLMRIGAHRVDYFEDVMTDNPNLFGFYVRGGINVSDPYSRDAKSQLYVGLMLIQAKMGMPNLRGIYVDVGPLSDLQRLAYMQLKCDLLNGLFRKVFILDEAALLGEPEADLDIQEVFIACGGFELIVCRDGECVEKNIFLD